MKTKMCKTCSKRNSSLMNEFIFIVVHVGKETHSKNNDYNI